MKFFHLSDLHLGKRLQEHSLLEDQEYILNQILDMVAQEQPEAVLIAGDVYDKAVPSAEAVKLCDYFLTQLQTLGPQILMISGNHDSAERLAFGSSLMAGSGLHISPVYAGELQPVTLEDAHGPVHFYLLPFMKPVTVREFFPEQEIITYTDAVEAALAKAAPDFSQRNVLLAHQYVTGAQGSSQSEVMVGGLDNVEATAFRGFDYVALGHIHRAQNVGSESIRYCGTPLHYSLSELGGKAQVLPTGVAMSVAVEKTMTVVELEEKGSLRVETRPLQPQRPLVHLQGSYEQLMLRETYAPNGLQEAYVYLTLTDDQDVLNAMGNLKTAYPRVLGLQYAREKNRHQDSLMPVAGEQMQSPLELFEALYARESASPMTQEQREYLAKLIGEIWEVAG